VNTHQDAYIPGSPARNLDAARALEAPTTTTPAFDALTWTRLVSDMEVDASSTYGNLAKRSGLTALDTKNTGAGTGTYYMAGMAYWANTNDIRLDKPVRVKSFSIDVDEGGNGSIEDTSPRGTKSRNSQFYLAAKYGGFLDKNKDGNPFKTFATDGTTVVNNNNEWASNGTDPDNYFLASDPTKMINSIRSIFQSVAGNSGTISGVTLTSTKISSDSSYVYQPGFDPSKWSGNLLKLELKLVDQGIGDKTAPGYVPDMVVAIQDAKVPTWDAGLVLTGKAAMTTPVAAAVPPKPLPASRAIYTAQINADKSLTTIPFLWASLTAAQKAYLDKSPVTPFAADGFGENRVDYLRGSRVDEIGQTNGVFRQRDRVLGDIINSNPTYVAAPASTIQGDDYKTFYDAKKNRTKAVYIGANDGMLHAFSASDGSELFAYVPNALISGLNQLTNPNYVHRPYVDGAMTVVEAKVSNSWKTILASGMGGGAQGAFVLDVTNPADFSAGTGAIWEFTDKDDVDMGNLTSPPQVAKFNTGTLVAPVYKYFVVVPSGLNNYKDDGASNFGTTDAAVGALFLLSLDKNPGDAWALGTNYFKVKTVVKDSSKQNGLSSPALVLGNDGAVRFAYAGDLQGNMWRFDFSLGAPASKTLTTPLFTALDGASIRQPITGQPKVITAPGGGYVVLFGTGKYVEDADAAAGNFKTQSFYGILDTTFDNVSGRSKLEARTLAKDTATGSDAMIVTGNNFTYGISKGQKMGWYFDFKDSGGMTGTGERSVTNPLVAYGRLFFNSLVTGSDPCATGGGRTYSLNALTGLPLNADGVSTSGAVTGETSTVGMLSSPVLFDLGTIADGQERDSIGKRVVKKKFSVFNFGTGGKAGTAAAASNGTGIFQPPAGRMSWREILNWQELHNAAKNK
ncbi:MAG: PilC/PilY family type IV pilus protein, partial [bacterium]